MLYYLVMGSNMAWGRGESVAVAFKNAGEPKRWGLFVFDYADAVAAPGEAEPCKPYMDGINIVSASGARVHDVGLFTGKPIMPKGVKS